MKERPILFNAPMVRALLDGSKTQTRRVVKPQPDAWTGGTTLVKFTLDDEKLGRLGVAIPCPYGQPGDRLWVRETHCDLWGCFVEPRQEPVIYRADGEADINVIGRWTPGIHMRRAASRITLEIADVRVERLQDISEEDAMAEGARECDPVSGREVLLAGKSQRGSFVLHYRDIWESINGPGSWGANPWVWVVEFKRITP